MPTPQGCKCRHCYGLAEYMAHLTGREYGLPAAPGHTTQLTLVAMPGETLCNGRLDCQCKNCRTDRAQHLRLAQQRQDEDDQPWMPRPSRHRRAA